VRVAALPVGLMYLAIGGVLAMKGRRQFAQAVPPVPAQAVESTKEDVEWLKTQAKSARR
jgi:hypothetical protein